MTGDLRLPSSEDQPPAPLMRIFFGCGQRIRAILHADVQSRGLEREEFDVIVLLGRAGGKTCKEVAEQVLVPNPTLTRTLARMAEKGLVKFERGEKDARQKVVSLTPSGQAAYERAFFPHLQLVDRAIAHLTADEQAELGRLLKKLAAGFTAESEGGSPHG